MLTLVIGLLVGFYIGAWFVGHPLDRKVRP